MVCIGICHKLSIILFPFVNLNPDFMLVITSYFRFTRMAVVRMSHDLKLGHHFSRHLYCDAFLTKDGLRLIPVHRNILAAVSITFAKIF